MLERGSGVALWRQIAGRLRVEIEDGSFLENGKLPNELDLAVKMGVNRHTVRRAIAELASEGLVEARRGEGTFVKTRALTYPIGAGTRFHEIITGQARIPLGTLIASHREPADANVAARLTLDEGEPVIRLETLHKADDLPISLATSWYPATRFPALEADFRETGSITQALQKAGVSAYSRGETEITARHATTDEAANLQLGSLAIVLVTEYVNADPQGLPVQYARTRFAAERIRLIAGRG